MKAPLVPVDRAFRASSLAAPQTSTVQRAEESSRSTPNALSKLANQGATAQQTATYQRMLNPEAPLALKKKEEPAQHKKKEEPGQHKKKEDAAAQHKKKEEPAQHVGAPLGGSATSATSATSTSSAPNATGLPHHVKAGVEHLSGTSLGDVRTHYNSPEPARVNALAFTQGNQIHVAPGQERHVPHEAWHAAQQKQGRVRATTQAKGQPLNNDASLEHEADVMGARAAAIGHVALAPPASDGTVR
jgi:hypothetical protein